MSLVIHGDADASVNKKIHSDRMVVDLRRLVRKVEYIEVPGRGTAAMPMSVYQKKLDFITSFAR